MYCRGIAHNAGDAQFQSLAASGDAPTHSTQKAANVSLRQRLAYEKTKM